MLATCPPSPPASRTQPPRSASEPTADPRLVALVAAARDGDDDAWAGLVDRFDAALRAIARSYHLGSADVDDVVQTTWVRLFEHIDHIRDDAAIIGWLATTTRRNALRLLQRGTHETCSDGSPLSEGVDAVGPEDELLAAERRAVLARAVATLPPRHRRLLTLLMARPELEYREISRLLGMPIGSIGPIRARCLERLRRHHELLALSEAR